MKIKKVADVIVYVAALVMAAVLFFQNYVAEHPVPATGAGADSTVITTPDK